MIIRDMFSKDINRPVQGVIVVGEEDRVGGVLDGAQLAALVQTVGGGGVAALVDGVGAFPAGLELVFASVMDDALEVDGGGGALPRLAVAEVLGIYVHVIDAVVTIVSSTVTTSIQRVEVCGQRAFKVVCVQQLGHADLLQVGRAGDGLRFFTGLRQRGQQHGSQDGDDRDHDQQFDQGETLFILFHFLTFL